MSEGPGVTVNVCFCVLDALVYWVSEVSGVLERVTCHCWGILVALPEGVTWRLVSPGVGPRAYLLKSVFLPCDQQGCEHRFPESGWARSSSWEPLTQ